jgi:hypothetical protein
MVCQKCEKKLSLIAVPDKWKDGARNTSAQRPKGVQYTTHSNPYSSCKLCQAKLHQFGAHYCQQCAYKKGICALCGCEILNTTYYRQSLT